MTAQLGIDIGISSLKISCLEKKGEGWRLLGLADTKTPTGHTQLLSNETRLAEEIKKLTADLGVKTKMAVVALPEQETTSRVLSFPPMKDEEVYKAIFYEAETFVPHPLDQVQIDYQIISKTADRILTFAVAAKRSLVESYEKIITQAGLIPVAIETAAVSLARIIPENLDKPVMVLDLGARDSTMIVAKDRSIYFSRTVPFGGEAFTRSLSGALGMNDFQAEEYKKAYGIKGGEWEGKIRESLQEVFIHLGEEIKKGFLAFSQEWQEPVGFLIISGGGASLPGLADELVKILGIEVQTCQPLAGISAEGARLLIEDKQELARFALSVGLAKREK
ncbi:MAG: type IV pilus assembly protein PilM [Candidatus Shapirobacteria bacterium]